MASIPSPIRKWIEQFVSDRGFLQSSSDVDHDATSNRTHNGDDIEPDSVTTQTLEAEDATISNRDVPQYLYDLQTGLGKTRFELNLNKLGYDDGWFDVLEDESLVNTKTDVEGFNGSVTTISPVNYGQFSSPFQSLDSVPSSVVVGHDADEYESVVVESGSTTDYVIDNNTSVENTELTLTGTDVTQSKQRSYQGLADGDSRQISIDSQTNVDITANITSEAGQIGTISPYYGGSSRQMSNDGEMIAASGDGNKLRIIDTSTGGEIDTISLSWSKSDEILALTQPAWGPDDNYVYVAGGNYAVTNDPGKLFKINTSDWKIEKSIVKNGYGRKSGLAVSYDGSRIWWLADSGADDPNLALLNADLSIISSNSRSFSPNGRGALKSANNDGYMIEIHNTYDKEVINVWDDSLSKVTSISGYSGSPTDADFGSDDIYHAGSDDTVVNIASISNWTTYDQIDVGASISRIETSPDGSKLAVTAGSNPRSLSVYDLSDNSLISQTSDVGFEPFWTDNKELLVYDGSNYNRVTAYGPLSDPSISVGSQSDSYDGTLSDADSYETTFSDIGSGNKSVNISAASGLANINLSWTERTRTTDPKITISSDAGSQTVDYSGTLADGSTADLSSEIDNSKIDGNVSMSVTVSDSVTEPIGQVGLEYRHDGFDAGGLIEYRIEDEDGNVVTVENDENMDVSFTSSIVRITPVIKNGFKTAKLYDYAVYFN